MRKYLDTNRYTLTAKRYFEVENKVESGFDNIIKNCLYFRYEGNKNDS